MPVINPTLNELTTSEIAAIRGSSPPLSGSNAVVGELAIDAATTDLRGVAAGHIRLIGLTLIEALDAWTKNHDLAHISWDYLKWCWWSFPGLHDSLSRFESLSALLAFLAEKIGMDDDRFVASCYAKIYDKVSPGLPATARLSHRNSVVASMKGRNNWHNRRLYHSLSAKWTANKYYFDWGNTTAIRAVQFATGITPPINDDAVIWWSKAHNMFGLPKPGTKTMAAGGRKAFNTVMGTYGEAFGEFELGAPFFLKETYHSGVIDFAHCDTADAQVVFLTSTVAAFYPLTSGNELAFLVTPYGFDSIFIDSVGVAEEIELKIEHKREQCPNYMKISAIRQDVDTAMVSLAPYQSAIFARINALKGRRSSRVPTRLAICRRNITTGKRSEWRNIGVIAVDVPHAGFCLFPEK